LAVIQVAAAALQDILEMADLAYLQGQVHYSELVVQVGVEEGQ
jgi:hypothetical protein